LYGATEIWLTRAKPDDGAKNRFCRAWLCPGEFSDQRIYDLQQKTSRSRSNYVLSEFKRALLLDPASAYRWADLSETMLNAGLPEPAQFCFQRALAAGPKNPAILFRAANFYFRTGDYPASLRYLSAILSDPELSAYYSPAFFTYSRMDLPIRDVLDKGIPQTPVAAQAFLRFLMQKGQTDDAETTWKWMAERSLVDSTIAGEYVSFLILKKQVERAAETWGELNRANVPEYRHTNWIFNGGFESPFRPSPLDWHIDPNENVHASRAQDVSHDGRSSLGLGFAGNANVDYHVWQQAVLPPGKWKLQAFVKTDCLTTDQGISLRISDALQPQHLDIRTDPLTGTHEWTKVERVFAIEAKTTLLQVEIMRQPSLRIDNKIAGKTWIDAVELHPTH
jgi:hypothetical protein